jgi:hypothetical protein
MKVALRPGPRQQIKALAEAEAWMPGVTVGRFHGGVQISGDACLPVYYAVKAIVQGAMAAGARVAVDGHPFDVWDADFKPFL